MAELTEQNKSKAQLIIGIDFVSFLAVRSLHQQG
jgi:hypothetical protein